MGKLILSAATTVDGVADGFEWYVAEGGHDGAALDVLRSTEAMLLGRKTYEGLAPYWSAQEGPWADTLNPMPKHIVSRTLEEPLEWNASLLPGEITESVPRLKRKVGGDLFMSGTGELARNLLAAGLVDELHFWLHPVVWGNGTRPFEGQPVQLRVLDTQTFDSGVTFLRYEPGEAVSSNS